MGCLVGFLALLQALLPLLHAHAGRDTGPAGVHLFGLAALVAHHYGDTGFEANNPGEPPAFMAESDWRQNDALVLTGAPCPALTPPALVLLPQTGVHRTPCLQAAAPSTRAHLPRAPPPSA